MANDRTKWVWTNETGSADFPQDGLPPLPTDSRPPYDATRPVGSDRGMGRTSDGERTSIYRPKPVEQESRDSDKAQEFDEQSCLVTGWVVVIDGCGRGTSHNLTIGSNTIGRDQNQQVVLNFGDKTISRFNHATIVYDDRARAFFIQHGDGKNLTRVNGNLVTGFLPLQPGDIIEVGPNTRLRFVPFCNGDFDWGAPVV